MSLVWKPRGQLGAKDDHAVVQLRIRIDDDKPANIRSASHPMSNHVEEPE